MKKRTVIFSILGVLVLTGGLVTGLILVRQNQNIAEKAAAASSIKVTPQSQSKKPGDSFTFSVYLDTDTNAVTTFDIEMTYDPSAIQIESLTKGNAVDDSFSELRNTFSTPGTISFSFYSGSSSLSGSGLQLLTVSATVKSEAAAGNYNLAFDPNTSAQATGESQNVLITKTKGTLTVSGSGITTTASPTPTPITDSTVTPTPESTSQTTPRPIPVTGIEWPTVGAAAIGMFVIIGSLLLAI